MTTPAMLLRAGVLSDQVRAEAQRIDLRRVLLTLAMVIPFVLGWLAGAVVRVTWLVISWTWAAAVVGWRTAYGAGDDGG